MKKHHAHRVVAGVDANGQILDSDWSSCGGQARLLNEGHWCEIPDDTNGGTMWICLKAWFTLLQFDMLGRWQMGPTVESSSAIHPCDKCDFASDRYNCYAPCTFVQGLGELGEFAPTIHWTERSTEKLNEQVAHLKTLKADTAIKAFQKATGVKKKVYPFHEDCVLRPLLPLSCPARPSVRSVLRRLPVCQLHPDGL